MDRNSRVVEAMARAHAASPTLTAGAAPDGPLTIALEGELLPHGLTGERAAMAFKSLWLQPEQIDVTVLPYRPEIVSAARAARAAGRTVHLAAPPQDDIVQRICDHLGCFDGIVAGKSLPSRGAPGIGATLRAWIRAVRVHQWAKNTIVFLPLLSSHRFDEPALIGQGLLAFLAFGLCASSVYVMNDILDLTDDRHHRLKRNRPFASGQLSIHAGLYAFPVLLASAYAISILALPPLFTVVITAYYTLTIAYSLVLKRVMALDVISLALLYTLRVIAGVAALSLTLTFWLLAFAMFLFFSLALAKRYAEIRDALERGRTGKARGRDYETADLAMLASLGAASGYLSVLVLALYIREQGTMALYANPEFLWLACPVLLFWITRVWMLTHRGQMHEDPVVFAVRDWVSHASGILFLLTFLAAT
jgi:4-hydroxybenzoate polyprenyltransferase